MPRIREVLSQEDMNAPLGGRQADPSDFGGSGTTDVGNAVQSAGHSAGIAQRIILQNKIRQEVTNTDTAMISANADLTLDLQNRVTNWKPGDGPITDTFDKAVKDRLSLVGVDTETGDTKFITGHGQRHFEQRAATLASQFAVESAKAQAHLDGLQAVNDHRVMVDKAGNLLQIHPGYFSSTRQDVENTIRNPAGIYRKIGGTVRDKMVRDSDEKLATDTVLGTIRNTPLLAAEKLKTGWMKEYIPDEKMGPLMDKSAVAVHAIGVEQRQAEAAARQRQVDLSHSIDSELVYQRAAHDANRKNPDVTPAHVQDAVDRGLDPRVGFTWLNMLDRDAKIGTTRVKTDPMVEHRLFAGIHAAPDAKNKIIDTDPIYKEYLKGNLTSETRRDLVKELTDARDPEGAKIGEKITDFLKSRMESITHSNQLLGKLDPEGNIKFGDFTYMVKQKVQQYQKDKKDPHDLFDPQKPDFLGTPERMKPYQKSLQESIRSVATKATEGSKHLPEVLPAEQMRKPNESYGDWKARQKP